MWKQSKVIPNVKQHITIHHGNKTAKKSVCYICGKAMHSSYTLRKHLEWYASRKTRKSVKVHHSKSTPDAYHDNDIV